MSFNIPDGLFGCAGYSDKVLSEHKAHVYLPEGSYEVDITLSLSTWKRPRWPFPKRVYRAEIRSESGIPVPGKGESSWDCGSDAVYSLTLPAKDVQEAVAAMTRSVLKTRNRYGSGDKYEVRNDD